MSKGIQYDDQFKKYAVGLSYEYGNIMKAARELNIPYALLYNWRKDYPFVRRNFSNREENTGQKEQK